MASKIVQFFKARKAEYAFTVFSYGSNVYSKVKEFLKNQDAQESDVKRVKNKQLHVVVNKPKNPQTEPTLEEVYAKKSMFLNFYFFCKSLDFLINSLFSYHILSLFCFQYFPQEHLCNIPLLCFLLLIIKLLKKKLIHSWWQD